MKNDSLLTHLLLASCLAGCATQEPDSSAQGAAPEPTVMSLDHATTLVVKHKEKFQSAHLLAAQRPQVKQEITELHLGVTSEDGGEVDSVMKFSLLPGGLQHYKHSHTDLVETGVDLFGVETILYWNSRFPFPFVFDPKQVSLTNGRLFSMDSSFALETKDAYHSVTNTCEPQENIPAHTIHTKLTGQAAIFQCTAPAVDVKYKLWYLADYARYINFEIYSEGDLQAAIRVKDVKLR